MQNNDFFRERNSPGRVHKEINSLLKEIEEKYGPTEAEYMFYVYTKYICILVDEVIASEL